MVCVWDFPRHYTSQGSGLTKWVEMLTNIHDEMIVLWRLRLPDPLSCSESLAFVGLKGGAGHPPEQVLQFTSLLGVS